MTVVFQVIIMGLVILLGLLLFKIKVITTEGNRCLSLIAINVANPATIFMSFQLEYDENKIAGFFIAAALAVATLIISYIIVPLVIRNKDIDHRSIERFSCIYSNCGFMGIPLVNGIFGADGVFYLSAYIAIFNIFVWTHGIVLMQGKFTAKSITGALKSPSLIAVFLGILVFLTQFKLPDFLLTATGYLSNMTTPLAMLVSGVSIAGSDLKKIFLKPKIYLVCAMKLLIIPIIAMFMFKLLPLDELMFSVIVAAAACPTATIGTIFAFNFKKDSVYAAEIFAVCTILSMVTLPVILWLCDIIKAL